MSETAPATLAPTGTYAVDPEHSEVAFVARHAMITKVRGAFNQIEGIASFNAEDPTQSRFEMTIQSNSVDTRNEGRDQHLRSADFFDVENYPAITFVATSIERVDETTFRVTGDMTIKDVTNPAVFDVELTGTSIDPWGNTRLGLEGSAVVNRKDWNLTWNAALEAGGVLVSEKVTLNVDISAVKTD